MRELSPLLRRYRVSLIATALAFILTFFLPSLSSPLPFALFIAAVLASAWHGGLAPGLLATALSTLVLLIECMAYPARSAGLESDFLPRLAMFVLIGVLASYLSRVCKHAIQAADWVQITLFGLVEAVIYTDEEGRVTFLNPTARSLTGCEEAEALEQTLDQILRLVDEETRQPVEDPAARVLRLATTVRSTGQVLLSLRNGTTIPVEYMASPTHDADGNLAGVILVFRDITERRQADRDLRQREEQFRSLVACAPVGIFLTDPAGRCLYTNPSCQTTCGFSLEESLGEGWARAVHPEDRDWVVAAWIGAARQEQPFTCEFRCQSMQTGARWARLRSFPIRTDRGVLIGHVATLEDLTERRQLEEAVSESQTQLQRAVAERRQAQQALQEAREELERRVAERTAELSQAHAQLHDKLRERQGIEQALRENHARLQEKAGELGRAHAHLQNHLQERQRAEEALRESHSRLQAEHEELAGKHALAQSQLQERIHAHEDLRESHSRLQAEHEELANKHALAQSQLEEHPQADEALREQHGRLMAQHEELTRGHALVQGQLQERQQAEEALRKQHSRLQAQHEELARKHDAVQEQLQERLRGEDELRTSHTRLQALLDNAAAAIYLKDTDGRYLFVNRLFKALFRLNKKHIIDRTDSELFPHAMADTFQASDRKAITAHTAIEVEEVVPQEHEPHTYLSIKAPLYDATGKASGICGVTIDITERKRAEELLRQEKELAEKRATGQGEQSARREVEQAQRRLCELVDGLNAIIWEADPHTDRFTLVSQHAQALLGYPVNRWLAEPSFWVDLIHPDDREQALEQYLQAKSLPGSHEFDYRALTADGRVVWLRQSVCTVQESSEVRQLRGLIVDVTTQKQAEAALQAAQRREEARITEVLTRLGSVMAAELDLPRLVQAVSDAATELLGAPVGSFAYAGQDEQGGYRLLDARSGPDRAALGQFLDAHDSPALEAALQRAAVVRVDDTTVDARFTDRASRVRSYLAVPVVSSAGVVLGGLVFGHPQPSSFTQRDEHLLQTFAAQAALALEHARLYQEARAQEQRLHRQVEEFSAWREAGERKRAATHEVNGAGPEAEVRVQRVVGELARAPQVVNEAGDWLSYN